VAENNASYFGYDVEPVPEAKPPQL